MVTDFIINDKELTQFITQVSSAKPRVASKASRWVRFFIRHAKKKMKRYAKSKKQRSTGNLSASITSSYKVSNNIVTGISEVPSSVKYQYAAEYGIKTRHRIVGRPKMTFSMRDWPTGSNRKAVPHRGYYVFTEVRRGKFKGRSYTQRAFNDVLDLYERNKDKVLNSIGDAILFSR